MNAPALDIRPSAKTDYPIFLERVSPYPKGWFLICFSDELGKGDIINRTFMGREVVFFRTQSGQVKAKDAYCAHLGAHLGYGGTVIGDTIKCPFFGYCFNKNGYCIKTKQNKKASKKIAPQWHVKEFNGLIMAFHHPAQAHFPDWEIPEWDMEGWSPLVHREYILKSHPLETTENSIDPGFLMDALGFQHIQSISPLHKEGASMRMEFELKNPKGNTQRKTTTAKAAITNWGLGHSELHSTLSNGKQYRYFVFATPIDEDRIYLRIAFSSLKKSKDLGSWPSFFPKGLRRKELGPSAFETMTSNVEENFTIWNKKINMGTPSQLSQSARKEEYDLWAYQFA